MTQAIQHKQLPVSRLEASKKQRTYLQILFTDNFDRVVESDLDDGRGFSGRTRF